MEPETPAAQTEPEAGPIADPEPEADRAEEVQPEPDAAREPATEPVSRRSLRAEEAAQRASAGRRPARPEPAPSRPDHSEQMSAVVAGSAKEIARPASPAAPVAGAGGQPPRPRAPRRTARRAGRVLLLLIVAVIVVALGTVVVRETDQKSAQPSATELARVAALDRASTLNASVQQLATAASPGMKAALQDTGTALRADIDALTIPATSTASATASAPAGSPAASGPGTAGAPTPSPASTVPDFVDALTQSSTASLHAAATADGGMARLLAAVGAGQLMNARALATTAGLPIPEAPVTDPSATDLGTAPANGTSAATPGLPGTGTPASAQSYQPTNPLAQASGPNGQGAATTGATPPSSASCPTPRTAAPGVNADQALLTAAEAEQKAVYAYQVSATRMTDPASSRAVAVLATHEDRLAALQDQLRSSCLALPDVDPGYTLASAFTQQPAAALASLEDQLGLVYGDLVALASGPVRGTAITALVQTAEHGLLWGPPARALPGLNVALPTKPAATSSSR